MSVVESLFVIEYQEDGSHSPMTLTEFASWFLADIERWFGPRDRSFTLVGIDIDMTPGSTSRLWYPSSGIEPDDADRRSRHVVVRLGQNALVDPARARWQLAHECFHLLDPWNLNSDGPTNWLEEGLAAWYQNDRVPEAEWHEGLYVDAEDLVTPLMDALPDAVRRIRMERRLRISAMTPDVLHDYCPSMSIETASELCKPFR